MHYRIKGSVGKGGTNTAEDVKLVQALLNANLRNTKQKSLKITGKCDAHTIDAIQSFQKDIVKMTKPDSLVSIHGKTLKELNRVLADIIHDKQPLIRPSVGIVTFDSEGNEHGLYYSRILHVPSSHSGLTLGRGYDMKEKSSAKIYADLVASGINTNFAKTISKANTLYGVAAKKFIVEKDLLDFHISPLIQEKLFEITYKRQEKETKAICSLPGVEKLYGKCDWDKLDKHIKTIVVDLKFRGDYTVATRKNIQTYIVNNDLKNFRKVISDKSKWKHVPPDRFNRRVKYLSVAGKVK